MEIQEEGERAVELSGLLEDTLKDTAVLLSREVQVVPVPNVAAAIPADTGDTTMVVGAVGDTFVTSHLITSGGT